MAEKWNERGKPMSLCEAHCKDASTLCEDTSDNCSCKKFEECHKSCRKDPAMADWKDKPVCAKRKTEKIAELSYLSECEAKCQSK